MIDSRFSRDPERIAVALLPTPIDWAALFNRLIGAGCSGAGSDEDASADSAEPTGEQLPTETELSTAVAPVATLPPATTSTSPASTTTIPTTSTTTTTAAPTTTIDPGDVNDFTALLLLGELRDGTNPELVESLVSDLEGSFILERVDLVSAHLTDDGLAELVIVGDSGYRTADYQVQAAADAVVYFGGLWAEVEAFCCGTGLLRDYNSRSTERRTYSSAMICSQ